MLCANITLRSQQCICTSFVCLIFYNKEHEEIFTYYTNCKQFCFLKSQTKANWMNLANTHDCDRKKEGSSRKEAKSFRFSLNLMLPK